LKEKKERERIFSVMKGPAVCCMSFHNNEYSHHPNYQRISCSVYGAFIPSGTENNFMQGSTIIFFSDDLLGSVQI